jgi:membrane fusion protein, multidrug efflux system
MVFRHRAGALPKTAAMISNSNRLVVLGACCVVLLVSCQKSESSRSGARPEAAVLSVQVVRAEPRPMERVIAATGTLAAQEQSVLSAKVPGRLERLAVDIGSTVRQGDLIAQIEPRDYELRLQQAAAALAQVRASLGLASDSDAEGMDLERISAVKEARAVLNEAARNLQRVKDLAREQIASQAELDTAEAAHTVALTRCERAQEDGRVRLAELAQRRAELEIARKQLADTDVRAPFAGAVQTRPASLGEYVAAGAPIVSVVETDPLRLRLEVPEREATLILTGQPVRLRIEADTNVYTGSIARISPALSEENRMLLVEADVPKRGALRPGLFARGEIIIDEHEDVLAVPASTLTTFAGLEKVVVVRDGRALETTVKTGRRSDGWVEIVSGLDPGAAVVLDPGGLRTGQPVTLAHANEIDAKAR